MTEACWSTSIACGYLDPVTGYTLLATFAIAAAVLFRLLNRWLQEAEEE